MPAFKLTVLITKDRNIRMPPEVPEGPAEIFVTVREPARSGRRFVGLDAESGITVPDDFDAPLPEGLQRLFEGHGV